MITLPTLERIDSPSGRLYKTPDGNLYPSVTTILSAGDNHDYLKEWRDRVGEKEANEISLRATRRGSRIHLYCENHLQGIENKFHPHDLDKQSYMSLVPLLNNVSDVQCIEAALYSDKLKAAGTVDCIARYNGILSVIDWKTSKREKHRDDIHSYFIQTSAYAYMFYERTGVIIDKLVIVMAVDHDKPLVFEENTSEWFPKFVDIRKKYSQILK